tara:strand:- start:684 stop:1055 length:372 start_codon:yes stop_codon:yes gene_type:complete
MGLKLDYPSLRATAIKDEKANKISDDYFKARKKLNKKFADRGTSGDAELEKQQMRLLEKAMIKMGEAGIAERKDLDLAKKYGKDAYKARSFGQYTGKKAGGKVKVMKMRGGGLATQGTKFSIR